MKDVLPVFFMFLCRSPLKEAEYSVVLMEPVGRITDGSYASLVMREKRGSRVEIGELLAVDEDGETHLLQAVDFSLASQLSQANRELIAGIALEEGQELPVFDEQVRRYALVHLKPLLTIRSSTALPVRRIPLALSDVRRVTENDFAWLRDEPARHVSLQPGMLRSGSRVLHIPIRLPLREVLSHHVLIAAQTGKGKSNLVKSMLAGLLEQDEASLIVFDAHDEYYGRHQPGLKDIGKVTYYSLQPLPGSYRLRFALRDVQPEHLLGVYAWSDAQVEALYAAWRQYGKDWLETLLIQGVPGVHEATMTVLKRRLSQALGVTLDEAAGRVLFTEKSIFSREESMLSSFLSRIKEGGVIILDVSRLQGSSELLTMTLIASRIFSLYREEAAVQLPVVSLIIEEAPRVLGRNVLAEGNVFERIAREGRKFGVGLIAITQMPSQLQRDVLANMNTKIILGLEMAAERQAVIESAAQDIRSLDHTIASLEKGEGIITSIFTRMPLPFKAVLFDTLVRQEEKQQVDWV